MENAELTLWEKAADEGKGYFREGLNCPECVLVSFKNNYNPDLTFDAISLCSAFGGGFAGSLNHTCGAIVGAVMALNSVIGRKNPFEKETMEERISQLHGIYASVAPMVQELEEHYGTLVCRGLCEPFGDFDSRERKKNCLKIIHYCSGAAVRHAIRIEAELEKAK